MSLPKWAQEPSDSAALPAWAQEPAPKQSVSQQVQPSPEEAQAAIKAYTNPTGRPEESLLKQAGKKIAAFSFGVEQGMQSIASTLAKGAASVLDPDKVKAIQETYRQDVKEFQGRESVQDNPYTALAGQVVGSSVALPPAVGVAGKAYQGVKAATGSRLLGLGAGVATGSQEAGVIGSLINTPENESVLNPEGYKTGMTVGGLLAPAQIGLGSYATRVKQYGEAIDDTKVTYRGKEVAKYDKPVFTRDLENTMMQKQANQIMDNLGVFGTGGARQAQEEGVKNVLEEFTQVLIKNAKGNPVGTVAKRLKQISTNAKNTRATLFSKLYNSMDEAYGKMPVTNTVKSQAKSVLDNFADGLTKQERATLQTLASATKIKPSAYKKLKGSLWDIVDKRARKTSPTVIDDEIAQGGKRLYGAIMDNTMDVVKENPEMLRRFTRANTYEKMYQKIFNPKTRRQFVKAIEDASEDQEDVKKFIGWLTNPDRSEGTVKRYTRLLGHEGKDAILADEMKGLLTKHTRFDTPQKGFNLSGYIQDLEKLQKGSQRYVTEGAHKSLQGLMRTVGKPVVQASRDANEAKAFMNFAKFVGTPGIAMSVAYSSGVLASLGVMAGVGISLKAMSKISTSSPVKRLLLQVDRFSKNPEVSSRLMQKAADQLSKTGIIVKQAPDGDILLDVEENKK